MKIKNLNLSYLRNNDHFEFHTCFKESIELFTTSKLKIESHFSGYLHSYIRENEMLDKILQNNITDDLVEADNNRDSTLSAMLSMLNSATMHFKSEVRQSAAHLKSLFELYNIQTIKTYDDQTASTNRLVEDLVGKYATDMATVGISDWVSELKIKNLVFDSLKKSRYTERDSQIQLMMKHIRSEVDNAYYAIINRINALIELDGESDYYQFVEEMNTQIDRYFDMIVYRKGRNKNSPAISQSHESIIPENTKFS